MNEPRKIAVVLLVVMALGLIALAAEWWRDDVPPWLSLVAVSMLLLAMALGLHFNATIGG